MEALSSAVSTALTGAGATRFFHRLWWHLASVLGIAWVASLEIRGTALSTVAGWLTYLGVPAVLQNVPSNARDWMIAHAELEPVIALIGLGALVLHVVRPVETGSPAAATFLVAFVLWHEIPDRDPASFWLGVAVVIVAVATKSVRGHVDDVVYAGVTLAVALLYTPLSFVALLLAPAQDAAPLSVRVAGGVRTV